MDLYALDRNFKRQKVIDNFISAIWSERYYGDDNFEILIPPTQEVSESLAPGVLIEEADSDIPMIVEDAIIEEGLLKITGISLLQWLNNRIIRASAYPSDDAWLPEDPMSPGHLIATIINYWVTGVGSPYLVDPPLGPGNVLLSDPSTIMGFAHPSRLIVPGLTVVAYDNTLPPITDISVPYGPVYDAVSDIATAYSVGIKIKLESVTDAAYALGFYAYLGKNRTSDQTVNPVVRFSPLDNTLANAKKLDSLSKTKTLMLGYAPNIDDDTSTYMITPTQLDTVDITGFDLRAEMLTFDEIDQDMIYTGAGLPEQAISYGSLVGAKLNLEWLKRGKLISLVDGEIVQNDKYIYGQSYGLGDTIEMETFEGVVSKAVVTEYIRSQDAAGEKNYPTVALVE